MDFNKVMLLGRLTRDPEVRNTTSGQLVATLGLATNSFRKDAAGQRQDKPEYHDVVVWGKLAEIAQQYITKGRRVFVEGRLQTRDWTGTDGVRRYKTEIVAENLIMLDGPNGAKGGEGAAYAAAENAANDGASQPAQSFNNQPRAASPAAVEEDEIRVEDIPF